MQDLRANTIVKVVIGPFVDVTDGFVPETGITLGAADEAELVKNDAAASVDISAATWAGVTNCPGYYNLSITAALSDTEGMLTVIIQDDSVCLPVRKDFMVLSEAAWDSKYVAKDTGFMDVNVKAVSEDTAAADNLELACDNYSATSGLSGTALPAVAADGAFGLPISDAGGLDLDTKLANTNEITVARMGALTDWINGGRLDNLLDAIPTTAMRGTDSAALASVVGALDNAAAAGEVSVADTLMQYLKQLINILIGTPGIGIFPAEAAPGNAVSLAEVIRAIHVDVTGLNGDVMRGTDGANTTTPPTVTAIQAEMEENGLSILDTLRDDLIDGGRLDLLIDAIKAKTDNLPALPATEAKQDTIDGVVDAILLDTGTDGVVVAAASKTGYTLSSVGIDAVFDQNSSLSLSFETLINRIYQMTSNEMKVTEVNGNVVLEPIGGGVDIATGNVASSSGTTTRTELSWT